MKRAGVVVGSFVFLAASSCASLFGPAAPPVPQAPLFNDLGSLRHPITTRSPLAQRFFDQGLILSYGFNHQEAARSFREAARLDPQCAMCLWGVALVLGPNINAPMDPASVPEAYAAVQRARKLARKATAAEQAYVEALTKRYAAKPPANRAPLDVAYADAMRLVADRFPDDPDAATLFAEALMDLTPWNYYTREGEPTPATDEIVGTLESVLKRSPDHPGAIHFYIHATEASNQPQRAEPYADRLGDLVPGAGHLVHMPSHTYMRVGRYHDASLANVRAGQADESYVTQCHAQGLYPLAYVPHNHHFLFAAASMEGNSAEAIRAALATDANTEHKKMHEPGMGALQHFSLTPLYAYVRFGKWDDILACPAPPRDLSYPTGIWHYARGRAFIGKQRLKDAERELLALHLVANKPDLEKVTVWDVNPASQILRIAVAVLQGEIAAARGDYRTAVRWLTEGVRQEDQLRYNEPPDWQYPVRHSLGAVLLAAKRWQEAERVYREDLRKNPENGWALFGLQKSLAAQGKKRDAAEVEERFSKAWQWADITLAASRF